MHQTKSDLCGVKRHISKSIFGKKKGGEIETVVTNTNWPQYISNNDSQLPMLPACPALPASQPANVQTNRSPVHSRSVQTETNFCAILQAPNQRTPVKKNPYAKETEKERKETDSDKFNPQHSPLPAPLPKKAPD